MKDFKTTLEISAFVVLFAVVLIAILLVSWPQ